MKKLSLAIVTTLAISQGHTGGIPVIDVTQIANQIQTWTVEAKRWSEQVTQFNKDYKVQLEQLAVNTGARDIAGFMKSAQEAYEQVSNLQELVNNPQAIIDMGKDALDGELKSMYESYGMFNTCEERKNVVSEQATKNCEGEIIAMAQSQINNQKIVNKIHKRVDNINQIAKRMEKAHDPKEAMDLSNAMQTQIALLNADKILQDSQYRAELHHDKFLEKQKEEEIRKRRNEIFDGTELWEKAKSTGNRGE